MRNGKSLWMFVLAALFAVGAAFFANEWLLGKRVAPAAAADVEPVVVASAQIEFGQRVEPAQLKVLQMPKGSAPAGVFRAVGDVKEKVALQTIYAGELVLEKKVRDHLGGSTLAAVIAPGKRAVAVRVNDVIGVAGFLLPGNRVDVIATRGDRGETTSETLLQDVKVLAVDQTASPDKDKPVIVRAVTLELSPREGEEMARATVEGSIQLTLRNPMEDRPVAPGAEPLPKVAVDAPALEAIGADPLPITLIQGIKHSAAPPLMSALAQPPEGEKSEVFR